ncbi:MAG: hypothetical protein RIT81_28105 [Deltaproteobacteria bacterium]
MNDPRIRDELDAAFETWSQRAVPVEDTRVADVWSKVQAGAATPASAGRSWLWPGVGLGALAALALALWPSQDEAPARSEAESIPFVGPTAPRAPVEAREAEAAEVAAADAGAASTTGDRVEARAETVTHDKERPTRAAATDRAARKHRRARPTRATATGGTAPVNAANRVSAPSPRGVLTPVTSTVAAAPGPTAAEVRTPDPCAAWMAEADSNRRAGRITDALRLYRRVADSPDGAVFVEEALYRLAWAYATQSRDEEARAALEEARARVDDPLLLPERRALETKLEVPGEKKSDRNGTGAGTTP